MKLIEEIRSKFHYINFEYKKENVKGQQSPFHTLYYNDECIISIMEGHEPKDGPEYEQIFNIVKANINLMGYGSK